MARIGVNKTKGNPLPDQTKNKAGGVVFNITDSSERLIHVIGHLANEPKYYEDDKSFTDPTGAGLDSEALGVVTATQEILNGKNPEDAFVIASWARDKENGLKLRTTPLLSFVTAAEDARPGTFQANQPRRWGKLLQAYAPKILPRADEPKLAFAAWSALYGNTGKIKGRRDRPIPIGLKKAIRRMLAGTSEQLLAKWAGEGRPSLSDVVRLCCPDLVRLPKIMYFVNRDAWLAGGAYTTPKGKSYPKRFDPKEATPVLWARYQLGQRKTWDDETKTLLKQAHVEWEFALSQFGHDPKCSEEIWATQFKNMPFMAMVKNLRNLVENGVNIDGILARLRTENEVKKSGLLPFNFLSAGRIFGLKIGNDSSALNMMGPDGRLIRKANVDQVTNNKILDALGDALDLSIKNLPELPGTTAILVDVSGSMCTPLSKSSVNNVMVAAAILAACFTKRAENAILITFDDTARVQDIRKGDTVLTIAEKMLGKYGGGTYGARAVEAIGNNKVDRIIVLSDMQMYEDRYGNSFDQAIKSYENKHKTSVWVHSVNLAGAPEKPTSKRAKVGLYSGFSEQLLTLISSIESGKQVQEETIDLTPDDVPIVKTETKTVQLPTIEKLREMYSLKVLG